MENKKNKYEEIETEIEEKDEDDDFGKKKVSKKEVIDEIEDDYEELSVEDRLFNIEKKVNTNLIVSVITIILVIITTIFAMTNKGSSEEPNFTGNGGTSNSGSSSGNEKMSYRTDLFDVIKPADLSKESKGQTIVVMIGRQTCSACAVYAPTLVLLQEEYDFTTKYIDFSAMITSTGSSVYISDEAGYNALISLTGDGYDGWVEENFGTTPLTMIIKDNKILYAVVGAVNEDTLKPQFEKFGIKKK